MSFKPMLAAEADLNKIDYPVIVSPKVDGIRSVIIGGIAYTRSMKRIPNLFVDEFLSRDELSDLDGEIIVGDMYSATVYRDTVQGVMSVKGKPDFRFYVFDKYDSKLPYRERLARAAETVASIKDDRIQLLPHIDVSNSLGLLNAEKDCVASGVEGICIRSPTGLYKTGRSTVNEGGLLKLKRFQDSEAEILEVVEEMHNTNEAKTNELGRTARSSAKAGLVGKGTMGALKVRDVKTKVEFSIGTGFTADDRAAKWEKGEIVKYKFFPIGIKDAPRHPVYLGRRARADI